MKYPGEQEILKEVVQAYRAIKSSDAYPELLDLNKKFMDSSKEIPENWHKFCSKMKDKIRSILPKVGESTVGKSRDVKWAVHLGNLIIENLDDMAKSPYYNADLSKMKRTDISILKTSFRSMAGTMRDIAQYAYGEEDKRLSRFKT